MKPSVLLAAVLLLPASVASAAAPLSHGAQPAGLEIPTAAGGVGAAVEVGAAAPTGATGVEPAAAEPSWQWPLTPRPQVLRDFDPPPKPWLNGHRGVDLRAVSDGTRVTSPAAGTVSFVGVVVDRPVITIDHGNGLRSSFEPVESTLAAGIPVAAGQTIGTIVAGHCPAASCVHWGVRRGDDYVNPLQFVMDLRPSILLPLAP